MGSSEAQWHLIIPSFMSMMAVMIGGILTYRSATRTIAKQHANQAIIGYISSIVEALSNNTLGQNKTVARLVEGKTHVAVYGSNTVIQKLAEFERLGADLSDDNCRGVWLSAIVEMRKQVGGGYYDKIDTDLDEILFSLD